MNNFTSYWDYSEKERSNLSEDEIKSLLDIELMTKGVLKPKPPVLREIKTIDLPRTTYYAVGQIYFETAEQAAAFLKLNPFLQDYDYHVGSEYKYVRLIESEIQQVSLCQKSDIINLNSVLSSNNEAKNFNEKVETEYKKQCKIVEDTCKDMWQDYYKCKEVTITLQRIIDTWKDYFKLSKGDCCIAVSFLKKAYHIKDIKRAMEWFETDFNCLKCAKVETCPEKIDKIVNAEI